jgi:hypothetical protein
LYLIGRVVLEEVVDDDEEDAATLIRMHGQGGAG